MVLKQQQLYHSHGQYLKRLTQKHLCKSKDIEKFFVFYPSVSLVLPISDKRYEIK